ncbi:hypothetical protein QTP70_004640 [Hemibagrus guttatus]|uniref:Transmembrane protein FAM155A n=1 Tax=Hemibagrus guttatus TaxID=175788 RepID=A0AAE0R3S6_9TELE|nr:hypothetical protein QTP70_004640 [Hemibagrus guttatus]
MTRGARTCRQQDDGLNIRSAPRQDEKPSADSERAQRWRLRLASFLFASVLLADRLWLCAAAERTSTEGERRDAVPFRDTEDQEYRSSYGSTDYTHPFAGNSSTPLWRLEACHPDSVSKSCFTVANAEAACSGLSDAEWNLSDLYLSFCDSYSLLDLFYGFSSPDNVSCGDNMSACSRCVRAFQRLDRLAQDRYHEFELLVLKYETDAYSVRTCMDECTDLSAGTENQISCVWNSSRLGSSTSVSTATLLVRKAITYLKTSEVLYTKFQMYLMLVEIPPSLIKAKVLAEEKQRYSRMLPSTCCTVGFGDVLL